MSSGEENPLGNYRFIVEMGEIGSISFSEVKIPDSEIGVIEYREGSDPTRSIRKLPGLVTASDLILRRGMTKSLDVYKWFKSNKNGSVDRRSIIVTILDESAQPCVKWKFRNCWPTKYSGPTLNATSNEYVIEELTISVEDIEREEV